MENIRFVLPGVLNSQIDYSVYIGNVFTCHASMTILELPCVEGSETAVEFLNNGIADPSWDNFRTNIKNAVLAIQKGELNTISNNFDKETTIEKLEFLLEISTTTNKE